MIKKNELTAALICGSIAWATAASAQTTSQEHQLRQSEVLPGSEMDPTVTTSVEAKTPRPKATTINRAVTIILEGALREGIDRFHAKAGLGVIMEASTGAIIASSSIEGLGTRPPEHSDGPPVDRVTESVYEIGSMFRLMTIGLALDTQKVTLESKLDARKPLRVGQYSIHDYHAQNRKLNVRETFLYSSNIATSRLAVMIGKEKHRGFLENLGQLEAINNGLGIGANPVVAKNWNANARETVSHCSDQEVRSQTWSAARIFMKKSTTISGVECSTAPPATSSCVQIHELAGSCSIDHSPNMRSGITLAT